MEENVPLDSTKKKQFLKSIKGIKKLIKKNEEGVVIGKPVVKEKGEKKKPKKFIKQDRGLVYLSHIPHGFYEHQMTEYFKQFGAVTNARVIKSKRTGRSKGFAFVEFREPSVAQIVAETMNNYLMGKRLLKAAYIPPEKQRRHAKRKNWCAVNNPTAVNRIKHKQKFNSVKEENEELKKAKKMLSNLQKTKTKLSELGINYDFFMPVDVPLELVKIKEEEKDDEDGIKKESDNEEKPTKQEKKAKKQNTGEKNLVKQQDKKQGNKTEPVKIEKTVKPKMDSKVKKDKIKKVDKKEQEQKQKKLDKAGVKNVENFIKVQESDNDSDSSADFDSDEYEKMLDDESEIDSDESEQSGDESDNDDEDDVEDDDVDSEDIDDSESGEESVVDYPPVKPKGKEPKVLAPKKNDKPQKQQEQKNKNTQVKRKAPQKAPVATKKPKFEKQNKPIPVKKQFKKKK